MNDMGANTLKTHVK